MSGFELPSNIRQIGGVDEHLRIYVEDYAVSYLKRYAETGGESDRVAFLVGKYMVIDSQGYLFISGAIQGKFTAFDEGAWTFSDESFEYAREQVERYFEGYEIVGWMQSQPGYGTSLNPVCADYHMNNFIKPYQALFVADPTEKLESFYIWDKAMGGMNEAKGYFVYYDRNRGMQEYMLDNKLTNIRGFNKGKSSGSETESSPEGSDSSGSSAAAAKARSTSRVRGTAGLEASAVKDAKPERREASEYRRLVNMMVSLSAVLFVIAFIMGAGLMQSDGRLGEIEDDMASLNNAYNYVLTQLSQLQTQAVFAASDNRVPDNGVFDNNVPDSGVSDNNMSDVTPDGGISDNTEPDESALNNGEDDNQTTNSVNQPDGDNAQMNQAARTPQPEPQQTPAPATPTPRATGTPLPLPGNDGANIELPNATIPPTLPPVTIPPSTPSSGSNSQSNGVQPVFNDDLSNYDTYTVQRGDNLSTICYRYYGTTDMLEKVMEVNNIAQPDMIYYGKVLLMPKIDDTGEPQ